MLLFWFAVFSVELFEIVVLQCMVSIHEQYVCLNSRITLGLASSDDLTVWEPQGLGLVERIADWVTAPYFILECLFTELNNWRNWLYCLLLSLF